MLYGLRHIVIILLGCVICVSPVVSADDPPVYISGTVTDEHSGLPISNVNIIIRGTRIGSTTDEEGNYFIGPIDHGIYTIEFSHIAYRNVHDVRLFHPGQTHEYDVRLSMQPIVLDKVEVTSKRDIQRRGVVGGRFLTREDIEGTGARRFGDIIRLMVPGARVRESGPDLFIELRRTDRRGPGTSFDDYLTTPLIIIDGLSVGRSPVGLNHMIQTEEIDEIVVLRELETSMYGHQGRYGVILIETTPQPDPSGFSLSEKLLYTTAILGASFLFSWLVFW